MNLQELAQTILGRGKGVVSNMAKDPYYVPKQVLPQANIFNPNSIATKVLDIPSAGAAGVMSSYQQHPVKTALDPSQAIIRGVLQRLQGNTDYTLMEQVPKLLGSLGVQNPTVGGTEIPLLPLAGLAAEVATPGPGELGKSDDALDIARKVVKNGGSKTDDLMDMAKIVTGGKKASFGDELMDIRKRVDDLPIKEIESQILNQKPREILEKEYNAAAKILSDREPFVTEKMLDDLKGAIYAPQNRYGITDLEKTVDDILSSQMDNVTDSLVVNSSKWNK